MIINFKLKETPLYNIATTKELIWIVMTIIFIIIYIKREKAQKAFDNNDMISAKNNLFPIATYLIPINIVLGIIAIFLGITLRGL
jgi:uncharacterized membrane protein